MHEKSPLTRYLRNQTPSIGTPAHAHLTAFDARLKAANLPADYRSAELLDADVTVAITKDGKRAVTPRQLRKWATDYAASFDRQFDGTERVKSLYLWSPTKGNGKTTTASALLIEWLVVSYLGAIKRAAQPAAKPAFFLDVNEWQTLYNGFSRKHVPEQRAQQASAKYYAWFDRAQFAPFAVLDDIGVRDSTEAFRGDLHTIINYRTTNDLPTIYTSNIELPTLADVFDERLADRVRDQCFEVEFAGESKRGIRK